MNRWVIYILTFFVSFFVSMLVQSENTNLHPSKKAKDMPYVSPELRPYVSDYLMDMERNGVNVSRYLDMDSVLLVGQNDVVCEDSIAVGCCDHNTIRIKLPVYIQDTDSYMKFVVYHEFGHCVLLLKHDDRKMAIMNSKMFWDLEAYRKQWASLKTDYYKFYDNTSPLFYLK